MTPVDIISSNVIIIWFPKQIESETFNLRESIASDLKEISHLIGLPWTHILNKDTYTIYKNVLQKLAIINNNCIM